MSSEKLPIIVLIALNVKTFKVLDEFIGHKYLLLPIDRMHSLEIIHFPQNVLLFMVDTDNPEVDSKAIVTNVKSSSLFENVPIIGLSLEKGYE